ncbi:MAG: recombination protein O N-terminal domain-containing protein [Patescibacteria group bacterium]
MYTTKAFVVHSNEQGEANKFIQLFTKDFGFIGAIAQGIRLSKSKLKYHIQDGSYANISIVRGKEVWRLTGANQIHSKINIIHHKILKLLKRLLHGEEMNEKLFEIVERLYILEINEEDLDFLECLTVLRILHNLGYIRKIDQFENILKNNDLNKEIIDIVRKYKVDIVKNINIAFTESHL